MAPSDRGAGPFSRRVGRRPDRVTREGRSLAHAAGRVPSDREKRRRQRVALRGDTGPFPSEGRPPSHAAGLLIPRDGSPPIAVQSHRVTVTVTDGLARTTLRQVFVNPHPRALEAVYLFPLPRDAALIDLAMEVGGQRLEGLLAERKQARRVYDQIVRQRRDPALVEQVGRGAFRLSVFPLLPKVETVVELTWIQHIPLSQGVFRYTYPLSQAGAAVKTEQDFTLCRSPR